MLIHKTFIYENEKHIWHDSDLPAINYYRLQQEER